MKKLLLAGLGLLLMAGVASAGWSLRQKDDGGAYWLNDKDAREEHVLVTHLIAEISNVTLPSSSYVISPITGWIEKIYAVITGGVGQGADETISFFATATTTGTFNASIQEITNGTSRMTLSPASPSAAGDLLTFTPNTSTANRVHKGGRIGIGNSGGSTDGNVRAIFTIVINPK